MSTFTALYGILLLSVIILRLWVVDDNAKSHAVK